MRDEISAGLKNALERGASLDEAIQTFINAGYNPVEVRESANLLTGGVASIISSPATSSLAQSKPAQQTPAIAPVQSSSQNQNLKAQPSSKKKTILLITVLIFLIALALLFIIYKEDILALLK